MEIASARQRVIIDAAIHRSVIRGTLTQPTGDQQDFHGWLELSTALEAILGTGASHAPDTCSTAGATSPAETLPIPPG